MKERQGIERDLNEIRFGFWVFVGFIWIFILSTLYCKKMYEKAYTQGFHDGMIITIEQYENPENLTK